MIKVKDLKDQIGTPFPRQILHCLVCGSDYSANSGDYWNFPKDYVFKCCDEPMVLAIKKTVYDY